MLVFIIVNYSCIDLWFFSCEIEHLDTRLLCCIHSRRTSLDLPLQLSHSAMTKSNQHCFLWINMNIIMAIACPPFLNIANSLLIATHCNTKRPSQHYGNSLSPFPQYCQLNTNCHPVQYKAPSQQGSRISLQHSPHIHPPPASSTLKLEIWIICLKLGSGDYLAASCPTDESDSR